MIGPITESAIQQQFQGQEFRALGLDVYNGNSTQLTGFRVLTGITYPLCLNASSVGNAYGVVRDRAAVIDRSGIIRYLGSVPVKDDILTITSLISNLLSPTGVEDDAADLETFELQQNYPNPFNPKTTIAFNLPESQKVTLRIFDLRGKHVRTLLLNQPLSAGRQELSWNGTNNAGEQVASGTYFYQLQSPDFNEIRRMVLAR